MDILLARNTSHLEARLCRIMGRMIVHPNPPPHPGGLFIA